MKAVFHKCFGDSSVLEVGQWDDPLPGPGQVLIRVAAAAVNPIDWKIREGLFECIFEHRFPVIPGWDVAGKIAALGPGAKGFELGDRVYAYCRQPLAHEGAYAQYIRLPESYPARLPEGLDFAAAATIPLCALTGWQSLKVFGRVGAGDKVLIHAGAGGVGSLGIQIAKYLGATVYATASAANTGYCRGLGADYVIDYQSISYIDKIKKLVPEGLDMIFDAVGGSIPNESLDLIKSGGALACLNEAPDEADAEVHGIRATRIYAEASGKALAHISTLIEAGALRPPEIRTFPLEAAAEAMDLSQAGHVRGKLVLLVD